MFLPEELSLGTGACQSSGYSIQGCGPVKVRGQYFFFLTVCA